MVLYGPWENTAYPMFMNWSVSLGWFWNCNAVNQKASFLCTLCIYIYFSDSLIFGKMYDKENIFFGWIYLFSFYMQTDFIYGVCLKKCMTPNPCLINQKSSDPPLSISNLIMTPLPFCRPLEINNDRSLNLIWLNIITLHRIFNFQILSKVSVLQPYIPAFYAARLAEWRQAWYTTGMGWRLDTYLKVYVSRHVPYGRIFFTRHFLFHNSKPSFPMKSVENNDKYY